MSTSLAKEETKKMRTLVLRPSSRTMNTSVSGAHGPNQSTRRRSSIVASPSRRRFSLGGGSKVLLEKSVIQTPRQAARVFDEEGNDVTPQPLYQVDPGAVPTKTSRFFVDEISVGSNSDQSSVTGSFNEPFSRSVLGSSRISSQSTDESINEEIEDTLFKRGVHLSYPDVLGKREIVKEQVTEEMLDEVIDVYISETEIVSLLNIPSTTVSIDAEDAEAITERNSQYAEICRNRMGNDKYVDRSIQTLNGAAKSKQVQCDSKILVDSATTVTSWDMYDSVEQDETGNRPEQDKADYLESVVETNRSIEMSMSVGSTVSSASASSSLREVDLYGSRVNAESDLQQIMLSERFQQCLLVMERSILGNIFHSKLATYRQLPILEDPDSPVKHGAEEQRKGDAESCGSPALEHLWVFTCELSRGLSISSMAWNKKIPDLVAVGYGELHSSNQKPGLVCCWSLKNLTWPERILRCDSAVTSLDFSASNPCHLAVGTHDGNIAIYNVSQDNKLHIVSSSGCSNKHWGPVWQLKWSRQELSLTGEEKVESLFSVSADGRIRKWFVFNNGLDSLDLMKLKRFHNTKKKGTGNNAEEKAESFLSALTSGLCLDFHSLDSSLYVVGTSEGLIHKCSCSNNQQCLETYKKHFCPVNGVAWSPFSPDVFLSCSSDWTIQLWKQDHPSPVLSFTSTQSAVCDVKWSPKWPTVFGAVNDEQLEIWNLSSSILDPVAVQPAAPGVNMKSLLFATQTDCVLVGDSDGQVTVYQLKNLSTDERSQVDSLEYIISSANQKGN
ncbi:dynein axonemal intermediate chain 4 [Betta splendens]|uniref:Dynein axonemal intermediate chain 4 n=1 Tax=Betta splendens TaxID=158456 RepID=A0A6P7KYN8_BETSP|nr:dynein axonemal intermediate chain 4 [Betta splendens]